MWQFILNNYQTYSADVLKVLQFIAASFSIFVFFKLRRIEKRYLFKATGRNFIQTIANFAKELIENRNAPNEIYRLLPQIEATIKSIKRMKITELEENVNICEHHLNISYKKRFKLFKTNMRILPTENAIWLLHGELHGLSTAIKDLQKENSWRS